jgi:UDP-glucose 4-epimerase
MAEWVKVHGARESSVFSGVEVARNMPPSWARAFTGAEAVAG